MRSDTKYEAGAGLVGGRYRIDSELGRGGTARVFRVLDERSGQELALKRLTGVASATLQAMFEREYHTLTQLAHPRIVRTFDYGIDADGAYYTMELLQGEDARSKAKRAPLELRSICMLLRDAASALALIHSRRMVHRDLSPRNLWCTPDGRGTLIDFGTLVAMGPHARVAGTPPYVPPEAVGLQALDARCDLYALGALGYVLLTQRDAYPARTFEALAELWHRRPEPPDQIRADVPSALSDLVMAMLSLDARARPASAAEVCERLTAIGELPPDDERHVAQAFLTSPQLVGREAATGFLRKRMLRAIRGRGSCVSIVAAPGLGRSRLLANAMLEAKLMGGAAVMLDARAAGPDRLALAALLAERVLETQALDVRGALGELAPLLGHLSPQVHRALGEPALVTLSPLERIRKLSEALVTLIETACTRQPLLIAVDDVHRADGASLGVLARLSLSVEGKALLLVSSAEQGALAHAPPALEQLTQTRSKLELAPLDASHTRELLLSLFGAIPGLHEAASWLHELSEGSPATCMQYAQYLVDHDIARYEGGRWTLPQALRKQGLPKTVAAMLDERVRAMSCDARALALGLALGRDESRSAWQPENLVRTEDLPKLLDGDHTRAFRALDELLHSGMVEQREPSYVLGSVAMVDALMRVVEPAEQRRSHARLAEIFAQGDYAQILPVRQLQLAGDPRRARAAMVAYAEKLSTGSMDWGKMRVSVSSACARNALADWAEHGGSPREAIMLRRLLLAASSAYDWSLARYGDTQLIQLQADIGMQHWNQTDPALPGLQRLIACLKLAQQSYDAAPEAERGLPPGDAVRELAAYAMPHSYGLAHGHDLRRGLELCAALAPLRPLSPLIELLADICGLAVERVRGRDMAERLLESIVRLREAPGLPDVVRLGGAMVSIHEQAMIEAPRGSRRALELMDRLASSAGEVFLVFHGRRLGYAFAGESARAQQLLRQVEIATEDDVWRRKSFLFVEAQLHALTGDLRGLQQVCAELVELTAVFPGWQPWLSFARAAVHRLHGDLDAALAELDAALTLSPPAEQRAYIAAAPAHAELLLQRGAAEAARRETDAIIAAVQVHALDRSAAVAAERIGALASSQLGDHAAAKAAIDRAFKLAHALGYGGLPLAQLYEAQASVEIARGESDAAIEALELLHGLLARADAPTWVQAYDGLRARCTKLSLDGGQAPRVLASVRPVSIASTTPLSSVQERLHASDQPGHRCTQALTLLLDGSGARGGHLFLFDQRGLFEAAVVARSQASPTLLALAEQYLSAELQDTRTAAVTVADRAAALCSDAVLLRDGESKLLPVLVLDRSEGPALLCGLALIEADHARLRHPRPDLVAAISVCLRKAGDSVAAAVE